MMKKADKKHKAWVEKSLKTTDQSTLTEQNDQQSKTWENETTICYGDVSMLSKSIDLMRNSCEQQRNCSMKDHCEKTMKEKFKGHKE